MNNKTEQYLGNPNLKKGHTQSRFSKKRNFLSYDFND